LSRAAGGEQRPSLAGAHTPWVPDAAACRRDCLTPRYVIVTVSGR
jgi:hypothetical protein